MKDITAVSTLWTCGTLNGFQRCHYWQTPASYLLRCEQQKQFVCVFLCRPCDHDNGHDPSFSDLSKRKALSFREGQSAGPWPSLRIMQPTMQSQ